MIVYYYIVYALCRVSRVYLELGTAFAYWRVVILMGVAQFIVMFVCFSWIDIHEMDRLLSDLNVWSYCFVGMLFASLGRVNETLILSGYDKYKREIEGWSSCKRKICDALVVLLVLVISLFFAIALKRWKAIS